MFSGSVGKIGQTYQVDLKIYDVESGQIEKAECEICQKCEVDALYISLRNIAYKISGLSVKGEAVSQSVQHPEELQTIPAKTEEITWEKDNSVMVYIPAGEFLMGSNEYDNEKPPHKVYLDAYYIDKYEVTNEQFANFLNKWGKDTDENSQKMFYEHDWGMKKISGLFESPQRWQSAKGYEEYPVINVTWYGANQYAKWAGKRLPTEAEWEKACRASSTTTYYYGNEENKLNEYAWYSANSDSKTHPVGTKEPNAWGIYDMHGNVWEWCSDWYDGNYYKNAFYKNPQGPEKGSYRVIRCGSWYNDAVFCRSANRFGDVPDDRWLHIGFRCARSSVQ